jgi:tRNA(fMet)-specific endonuclease VapC
LNCIDSDLIIAYLKGDEKAKKSMDSIVSKGDVYVSSISVFEVTYTTKGLSEKKERILENFIDTLKVLDLDRESAKIAGRIGTDLAKKGEMIHPMDLLIGAICKKHRMNIVTSNVKHFSKISGLKVVDWTA